MSVLSIAQDLQGPSVAIPWLRRAGVTFPSVIDQFNVVGKLFKLKAIPIGILVDEDGRLVRPVGGVDIDREPFSKEVTVWAETGEIPESWSTAKGQHQSASPADPSEAEADVHFQRAIVYLHNGERASAIKELGRAYRLDPANYIIRKQRWALEAPEMFYADRVDYEWQRRRQAAEDAAVADQ